MHATHGVCSRGLTVLSAAEAGSWLSRAMLKQSRITFAWIESRQMKIAIETTARYVVANAFEKFASITAAGPSALLTPPESEPGIAIRIAQMKMPPITNAPMIEKSTAFGASLRGFFVSSASVAAVSKP
jgi:hypothetical protein